MRVVIVTESFPPDVNGVAHCALQTARHLVDRGHLPLVVAPATAAGPGSGVGRSSMRRGLPIWVSTIARMMASGLPPRLEGPVGREAGYL